MSYRIPLQLRSITSRINVKFALCSSSVFAVSAGFYRYHATQPTSSVIASPQTEPLYHTYDTNSTFSRISIPSGKATVIHPTEQAKVDHILITIQGDGEVQYYSPNHVIHGHDNTMLPGTDVIIAKRLKMGNSVGVPSTNWHQIINKHKTKDLILVVTSIPSKN